jgi:hypothetical protein
MAAARTMDGGWNIVRATLCEVMKLCLVIDLQT